MRNRILLAILGVMLVSVPALAHPGVGIVVDSRGNIFYTDLRQVWKIAPDGAKSVAVPNVHTHELCLDSDDNLFGEHLWYEGEATDRWGHRVWKLTPEGRLEEVIPPTEGFLTDYSFVRDRRGNMYWAGEGEGDRASRVRIVKRAPDGTIALLAGGTPGREDGKGAAARFTDIRWMTVSPEGTVYAIDLGNLRKVAPDGTVTTLAAALDERRWTLFGFGRRHLLMGLWPDAKGNVYVADAGTAQVKRVAPDGRVSVVARSPVPYSPAGVTVTPAGDVLILECAGDRARVRRISRDGTVRVF